MAMELIHVSETSDLEKKKWYFTLHQIYAVHDINNKRQFSKEKRN